MREFPGGPVVRTLHAFTAEGPGSIQGSKIPQVTWCGQKKKKKIIDRNANYCKKELETIKRSLEKLENSFPTQKLS